MTTALIRQRHSNYRLSPFHRADFRPCAQRVSIFGTENQQRSIATNVQSCDYTRHRCRSQCNFETEVLSISHMRMTRMNGCFFRTPQSISSVLPLPVVETSHHNYCTCLNRASLRISARDEAKSHILWSGVGSRFGLRVKPFRPLAQVKVLRMVWFNHHVVFGFNSTKIEDY